MNLSKIKHLSEKIQRAIVEEAVDLSNAKKVSEEEFERRIKICEACDYFNPENRKCKLCTCFMDVKAQLAELLFVWSGDDKTVRCADKQQPKW